MPWRVKWISWDLVLDFNCQINGGHYTTWFSWSFVKHPGHGSYLIFGTSASQEEQVDRQKKALMALAANCTRPVRIGFRVVFTSDFHFSAAISGFKACSALRTQKPKSHPLTAQICTDLHRSAQICTVHKEFTWETSFSCCHLLHGQKKHNQLNNSWTCGTKLKDRKMLQSFPTWLCAGAKTTIQQLRKVSHKVFSIKHYSQTSAQHNSLHKHVQESCSFCLKAAHSWIH